MPKFFAYSSLDGFFYAVFDDTDDAWNYFETNGGMIACFNGYENAVRLTETLGM